MTIRTPAQYVDGLRDGRRVFYRGERVKDVTANAELRLAIDHSSLAYSIARTYPALAVDAEGEEHFSAFYRIPRSARDLRERGALIERVAALGAGVIVLKEVGSDALFALLRATEGEEQAKARAFYDRVRRDDLALAVAQTDVKGDRTKAPHEQSDPDLYLRIVAEDADSITVRGAKCHTSFSANADELIVLPTRAMGPKDRDYAVAFAIPIDHPGLTLYVSPYSTGDATRNSFDHPVSSRHKLLESLTVFDNVRVPKERVFLNRKPERAGPLERFSIDVNRNSKGVPRGAQIRFGLLDSNGEVARWRRDTRTTSGRGRSRLSKTARADGKRRGCSVSAPRPQSAGSSAGQQRAM